MTRAVLKNPPGRRWPGFILAFVGSFLFLVSSRGQSVSLAWNPGPSGDTGYYIYYGTHSGSYSAKIDVGTNTIATLSGLTIGQTYYFAVTGYNSARMESLPSNQASFVVPSTPSVLAPQLTTVSPTTAPPGAQVFIYGVNFTTATSVSFAGVNAPFTVSSDGFILATVPVGAASGSLVITTAHGVVSLHFVVVPGQPPANDNFNNSQLLTGVAVMASTNTVGATKQSGEPNHAGNAGGSSVWYRWTAPAAGTWSLDTAGSSFNTLLAVYTGTTLTGLSPVASSLVSSGSATNSLAFTAVAGVTYQIAADGNGGAAGNLVLHLAPVPGAATTIYSTAFETANGFFSSLALAGQAGWQASGNGGNGLKVNLIPGNGQQACIGFTAPIPATSTLLYVPLNYAVNTNSTPLIQFSVTMQINATVLSVYNSTFAWVVRNASGQELFRISFDDYAKTVSYTLNNGAGPVPTGQGFNNSTPYNLVIAMDFGHNSWSASLGGIAIISGQRITTTGAALTLGDIDAGDVFEVPSLPGTDGMLFDNYAVSAGPSLAPMILQAPASQTVAAGRNAYLGTLVSGASPMWYQWYLNNNPVANATNSGLLLTALTNAQSGSYSVTVSNPYGSALAAATLTVTNPPPKSLFSARMALNSSGASLSLNVAAGNSYRFQSSTNLRVWTTLGSFFAMGTNALCFDPTATNGPCRFYRLVSP
jgi:hypothetical protein